MGAMTAKKQTMTAVLDSAVPTLRVAQRITSPASGLVYRIGQLLGTGGFGAAYSCQAEGADDERCLKVTFEQASWHREAYMGELLRGHPRVVQIYETFPMLVRGRRLAYVVIMELAEHGTVADTIDSNGAWSEPKVIREIPALLGAVDQLHASGALHRDITPFNVFVCGSHRHLKLGDFGICTHGPPQGVKATAFAPWFVDSDVYWEPESAGPWERISGRWVN
jgi:serine/threonine protein kinase